ncbi:MAG: HDIG domain-containing protein [Tissierellia bacterium]|nr:HDIG domain-containing protein [Tissierellia bacterium]
MRTGNRKKLNILIFIVYLIVLSGLLLFNNERLKKDIVIGKAAPFDIYSKNTFEDVEATEENKKLAERNAKIVYKILPTVSVDAKNNVDAFFSEIHSMRFKRSLTDEEKIEEVNSKIEVELEDEDILYLLGLDYQAINKINSTINDLMTGIYSRGVSNINHKDEIDNLIASFKELNGDEKTSEVAEKIINKYFVVNEVMDEEATEKSAKAAVNGIPAVMINEGDLLKSEGEIIEEDDAILLSKAGILTKEKGPNKIASIFKVITLMLIPSVFWIIYIYIYNRNVYLSNKMTLLFILDMLIIIASVMLSGISPLLMPVVAASIIVGMLMNHNLAIINNVYLIMIIGIISKLDSNSILYLLISSNLTTLFINSYSHKINILITALFSALFGGIMILSLSAEALEFNSVIKIIGFVLFNGIGSCILALGSIPFWENMFSILTPTKLYELADMSNPLLNQLSTDAPGTYQHSIMVGNLSENAAKKIGANSMLAKVGAYYHDVGKLENPLYFSENQFNIENPHNKLSPEMSAKVIIDHVSDGVKMAKKHRLPVEIIDFIEEHHGTTKVGYFLFKAKETDPEVDENLFKYKGRKPQSKETAIVMIADSCEAATRSIKQPTNEAIENMVDNIIKGKDGEKQFNECNLTFKELDEIRDEIVKTLKSIYHGRIEYPKKEVKE